LETRAFLEDETMRKRDLDPELAIWQKQNCINTATPRLSASQIARMIRRNDRQLQESRVTIREYTNRNIALWGLTFGHPELSRILDLVERNREFNQ
jgi:hypothetical protein